eukprot:TRINITY_DN2618_c2_g1_i1.p2 TRINITY_DN2618_c2_g1~~TRINITY_DN2618_c2_g1_i1.p2  ORF type:complete len:211 (+),score=9.57 TRINITY_DN2618_c2_g1_i1:275-907(+)
MWLIINLNKMWELKATKNQKKTIKNIRSGIIKRQTKKVFFYFFTTLFFLIVDFLVKTVEKDHQVSTLKTYIVRTFITNKWELKEVTEPKIKIITDKVNLIKNNIFLRLILNKNQNILNCQMRSLLYKILTENIFFLFILEFSRISIIYTLEILLFLFGYRKLKNSKGFFLRGQPQLIFVCCSTMKQKFGFLLKKFELLRFEFLMLYNINN